MSDFNVVIASAGALALGAVGFVKAAVDGLKLALPGVSSGVLMLAALLFGVVIVNVFALASGAPFTAQNVALWCIAGVLAGFGSMGLHEISTKASMKRADALYGMEGEPALALPPSGRDIAGE